MTNYISRAINDKIDSLKLSFETNRIVKHQGVKGSINELILSGLIQDVIPRKFKLTNGVIQDSRGFQSNETDIIIYDNEILPEILFSNTLGFIPAESVQYIFEIKSTLTAGEVKGTIGKFHNIKKCKGFVGRPVLFAFSSDLSKKSELERYYEHDKDNFLVDPHVRVIMVAFTSYYFYSTQKIFLHELLSKEDFAHTSRNQNDLDIKVGNQTLQLSAESFLKIEGDLIINDINYDDLYVNIHRWYGVECEENNNCSILSFLSGISNTLSKGKFGEYLLADCEDGLTTYSECIVDMWGNVSYTNKNFSGYKASKLTNLKYSISLRKDQKHNKISIYPK